MVVRGRAYYDRTEALAPFEPILAETVPNAHTTMLEEATTYGASPADDPVYATAVYEHVVRPYAENGKDPDPLKFQQFYTADARMINPGFVRPLRREELPEYYTGLKAAIRNLQLHLERWAVAPGLLFIEWTVTGELAGKHLRLANTDRFTLRDMQVIEGVAYFDNLLLRALSEPDLARFATVSFADVSVKRN